MLLLVLLLGLSGARASISVHYPDAQLGEGDFLSLRGDACGLSWSEGVRLDRAAPNTWKWAPVGACDLASLEYKSLLRDSLWQVGANERNASQSYPFFKSHSGSYSVRASLSSQALGNSRDVLVYFPPSYEENTLKRYEVLVVHDGQNCFNDSTSFLGRSWRMAPTLDALVVQGAAREVLVVALYNTPRRNDEYTYSRDPSEGFGGEGDRYLDWIESTVLPWIYANLRARDETRDSLGMLGSSLGGLISCYAGWTRSSVYGRVGCMSSSFWWNDLDFNTTVLRRPKPEQRTLFYLDSGNAGPSNDDVTQTRLITSRIQGLGWAMNRTLFYYLDNGGEHGEQYWGERFYIPMMRLYGAG